MPTRKHRPIAYYRSMLRAKGWTLRTAAPLLGVHFSHLHHVLTGSRHSAALLARIEKLPIRKGKQSGNNPQP